jgi:hypothetical protein
MERGLPRPETMRRLSALSFFALASIAGVICCTRPAGVSAQTAPAATPSLAPSTAPSLTPTPSFAPAPSPSLTPAPSPSVAKPTSTPHGAPATPLAPAAATAAPVAPTAPVPTAAETPAASAGGSPQPGAPTPVPSPSPTPSPTPTPEPIIVEPPTAGVVPGGSQTLRVTQVFGNLAVTVANPQIASASVDSVARTLTIVGNQIGTTTVTVRDDRGLTRDVSVRVAYPAGVIPSGALLRVTGRPATELFLRSRPRRAALRCDRARRSSRTRTRSS